MAMQVEHFMGVMLLTGAANTLLMKHQVLQEVPLAPGMTPVGFEHPFFQTLLMMMGEVMCLGAYFYAVRGQKENSDAAGRDAPAWVFLVPCACDWTATTFVNGAYIFLPASIIQMTRGAIVLFTCLFSIFFLGRRQEKFHFLGVSLVFLGIFIVSFSAFEFTAGVAGTMLGIALCVGGQVFQASMIVYEEKVMKSSNYDIHPLQMVGMEGMWGCLIGVVLLTFLNIVNIENTVGAVHQMMSSTPLFASVVASIFSIAFFNWSGVTVTQKASAVSRSTVDCSRTILIWIAELSLRWNTFSWMQLIGFVFVAAGTLIYNKIVAVPFLEEEEAASIIKGKEEAATA